MQKQTNIDWSMRWIRTLPNPTYPTAWAMATTATLKTGMKVFAPGQQHLWFTIHGTGHQMDACGMRIPSKVDLAQGNKSGQPYRLANVNRMQCQQIMPWNQWNIKGAHESDSQECTFHQSKTNTIRNMWHLATPWQESERHVHGNVWRPQDYVFRPNRTIPDALVER